MGKKTKKTIKKVDVKSRKKVIRGAMKKAVHDGVKLMTGGWGTRYDEEAKRFSPNGAVCALGALLVYENGSTKFNARQGQKPLHQNDEGALAACILGVDSAWVDAFIAGFDQDRDMEKLQLPLFGAVDMILEVHGVSGTVLMNEDGEAVVETALKGGDLTIWEAYRAGRELREEFGL